MVLIVDGSLKTVANVKRKLKILKLAAAIDENNCLKQFDIIKLTPSVRPTFWATILDRYYGINMHIIDKDKSENQNMQVTLEI